MRVDPVLSRRPFAVPFFVRRGGAVHVSVGTRRTLGRKQWRGYADDAKGVAIGVDLVEIESNANIQCEQIEIEYDEQAQREFVRGLLGQVNVATGSFKAIWQAHDTFWKLCRLAPTFKNPKFTSEREVRLLVQPSFETSEDERTDYHGMSASSLSSEVEFFVRDGILVPFVTVTVPNTAFKEVWLGPRYAGMKEAVGLFLSKHGCAHVEVKQSKASLR